MQTKSFTQKCLVLRRTNVGETDRIVTLLSQEQGRFACVAKGVRKLKSSNRAYLEPGSLITAHCIVTKSLPILTQTTLVDDTSKMTQNLSAFRALSQILEIIDTLFVEEEIDHSVFMRAIKLRNQIVYNQASAEIVRRQLAELITKLGFQNPTLSPHETITEYLQSLIGKPLHSYDFLKVGQS
ncbi:MAG: DNA repair protein RecO [Candidatus Pacebacteria bacterium]|nr:DNA repair protein RecO [Candidatus Paceibacterota bacterium]NCS97947.1 DNA repair protein RecO [Candidatus Paceibacterota bacterium]PIZ78587.1 MAG: DNA repair protein RecO [Candidatus Pacebacteria bacterium CG_4_10_14_0_2_um_filter_40_20]PJA69438.1 MAG: DNA repair protein RecO [Candidatus Pacebacteria bacterium CG_4_9_14_3_um_filter_40_12]PJC41455.1 MAG: DNA repair protein RecO [Candidatus Pacebacteria bacterium CG_4_9_14_0_2_um_filter_40_15]